MDEFDPLAIADRCEKAVNSCRRGALETGGAKWVASVDEFIASLRAQSDYANRNIATNTGLV